MAKVSEVMLVGRTVHYQWVTGQFDFGEVAVGDFVETPEVSGFVIGTWDGNPMPVQISLTATSKEEAVEEYELIEADVKSAFN